MGSMCWWASCGGNTIMGYIKNNARQIGLYTIDRVSAKGQNWAKVTMGMDENHGWCMYVCVNAVLVKSCHERTKSIGQYWCLVSVSARLLHSHIVAIGFVLYWMSRLQCCVLITHGAVVKVQIGLNVHDRKTSTSLSWECLTMVENSCIVKSSGGDTCD